MASGPLSDAIDDLFDPINTAAVFLRLMNQELDRRGITLHLHEDFEGLADARGGTPLMPNLDPRCFRGGTGFWLEGRSPAGEPVANHAVRLYRLASSSLAEQWESLAFLYDPVDLASPGEACRCRAPMARQITGKVVYSGALWVHPNFRGRGTGGLLPQMSRVLAYRLWPHDYTIAVVGDDIGGSTVPSSCGYGASEPGIQWTGSRSYGDQVLNLLWLDRRRLLEDLAGRLAIREAA